MRHPYRHIEDPTMHVIAALVLAALVFCGILVLLMALALGF
jgi:hypothetical protein